MKTVSITTVAQFIEKTKPCHDGTRFLRRAGSLEEAFRTADHYSLTWGLQKLARTFPRRRKALLKAEEKAIRKVFAQAGDAISNRYGHRYQPRSRRLAKKLVAFMEGKAPISEVTALAYSVKTGKPYYSVATSLRWLAALFGGHGYYGPREGADHYDGTFLTATNVAMELAGWSGRTMADFIRTNFPNAAEMLPKPPKVAKPKVAKAKVTPAKAKAIIAQAQGCGGSHA